MDGSKIMTIWNKSRESLDDNRMRQTEKRNTNREREMSYGIKKRIGQTGIAIMTETQGWMSSRHVGLDALKEQQWKTRKGAERNAKRFGGEVFTITETMNY